MRQLGELVLDSNGERQEREQVEREQGQEAVQERVICQVMISQLSCHSPVIGCYEANRLLFK